eukprot:CAMPEP_0172532154 /NCGR_PEP_ID=MMETSP1067-20121228/5307_1 /TAXON_ID=265564 ORGANISM="Thalassiosira punctigera, Strain Tpunct2005C2" /NCGR_SAMPLE_ID=MMETSP1067 /ASSEMBLY_ACC=CAM_ASM_000444 /LENGTH=354 /DNA_ID=CAMNT_0013316631 /DNA_START=27 /DNA_END=1091 /DNA_ORIENTATION=+
MATYLPSSKRRLVAIGALLCFLIYTATRTLANPSLVEYEYVDEEDYHDIRNSGASPSLEKRNNCQIIYILGVEGSIHHGFSPIIEKLATQQVEQTTGAPYKVSYPNGKLRAALFGHHGETRPLDDPSLVSATIKKICPSDGKKHVIIEDSSFPAGYQFDDRTYRIHRMPWWSQSTMEEVAMSETAKNHPTNLDVFYKTYSPYADIKFVVIHRSFVETIASHYAFDETIERHSNVIRAFMLLLRRFLDSHPTDERTGLKLWTLVCVEHLSEKSHAGDEENMNLARRNILRYLAEFLGWSQEECPECFSHWRGSSKKHLKTLGQDGIEILLEHMRKMGGIWPPVVENALQEQKCSL